MRKKKVTTKALLVIDMQNVYIGDTHSRDFTYDGRHDLVDNVNKVIKKNKKDTIIYVRNIVKRNFINKINHVRGYEDTYESLLIGSLNVLTNNIFTKYKEDAFTNSELSKFLKENGITEIEIVGIDGAKSIYKTALRAIRKGYKVTINTTAIGTMYAEKEKKCFDKLRRLGAEII